MKNIVVIFSAVSISFTAIAAPKPLTSTAYLQSLSTCEQEIYSSLDDTRKQAWRAGVGSVALGAMGGLGAYGIGLFSESMGSSSEIAFGGAGTEPGSASLMISAIGTGVVIAAIAVGANYIDYRIAVDRQESLLQLFKEVRNNGMGPQMDLRVLAIQDALKQLNKKAAKKMRQSTGSDFNVAAIADENVRSALLEVVNEYKDSRLASCEVPAEVSKRIDKVALQILIEKFNPSLRVLTK